MSEELLLPGESLEALDAMLLKKNAAKKCIELDREIKKLTYAKGEVMSVRPNKSVYTKRGQIFFMVPKETLVKTVEAKLEGAQKALRIATKDAGRR